jgi:HPt (histidine-containing phosphotransfer) domain-containing protein
LIPAYLSNRRDDIVALPAALENNDVDLIRTIGHGMKGSGGGYGFSRISEIGRDLERAANETNSREIQNLTHALAEYIERLEIGYK